MAVGRVEDQADGIGLCMDYSGKSVTFGHYPEGIKSKAAVQDNQWHHVAGTMRREGRDYVYSIYVDGKLAVRATADYYGHVQGKSLALGYIDTAHSEVGTQI